MNARPGLFTAAALAALAAGGCHYLQGHLMEQVKATGPVTDKQAKVDGFDKMSVEGPFEVLFTVGPTKEIKVEAQKEVLELTNVMVEGGTLRIFLSKPVSTDKPIKVYVASPNLTDLKISGACTFKADGTLAGPLKAEVSGASTLQATANMTDLEASGASTATVKGTKGQSLKLRGSGASTVVVVADVDNVEIEASGASTVKPGVSAKSAKVNAHGASNVKLAVGDQLDAHASGASTITYSGAATHVNSQAEGASSVNHGQ
ncbi:MAG: DUF2807 domain-containing protein [Armatimonadetes bacterium]|nr:DUF2807 domain-containing protein [Armatimonadota bacterium]